MEYFIGKSLFDIIKQKGSLSEIEVKKIGLQIISFLKYIHGKGIVYRDIKLENIIYDGQ